MSLYFILYTLEKDYNIDSTNKNKVSTNKISTNKVYTKSTIYSPQPAPSPLPNFNPNKINEYYNVQQADSTKETFTRKKN